MQAFAAGGLAEADEAQRIEPVAHLACSLHHRIANSTPWPRIQIEARGAPAGPARRAGNSMDGARGRQPARSRRAPRRGRFGDTASGRRTPWPGVSKLDVPGIACRWKKCCSPFDAVGGANDGARPALDVTGSSTGRPPAGIPPSRAWSPARRRRHRATWPCPDG